VRAIIINECRDNEVHKIAKNAFRNYVYSMSTPFTVLLHSFTLYKNICHYINKFRWVDNIKINLREIGWDGMDCIDLAQDRDQWRALANTVMNLRVP
jgi:hypothetical protein